MRIIEGDGFILRSFKISDIDHLVTSINEENVLDFIPEKYFSKPFTKKSAEQLVEFFMNEDKSKVPNNFAFAVEIEGNFAGTCGIYNIENHIGEVGLIIKKKYWGKGLGTKVISLLTDFGFDTLKLKRLWATPSSKNKASIRIMEKCNYRKERILKNNNKILGEYQDDILYTRDNPEHLSPKT